MSKLYKKYVLLKIQDSSKIYLFEVGIFYLFLDEDAKLMSQLLNLKLSNLNSVVQKCGFPINSSNKYFNVLKNLNYNVEVIPADETISSNSIKNHKVMHTFNNIKDELLKVNIDNISISQAFDLLYDLQNKFQEIELDDKYEKKD